MTEILDFLKNMFENFYLMSVTCSWIMAQIIKIFTGVFQNRKMSLTTLLFSTGGMPSSHAAAVVALASAVGLSQGFGSAAFACAGVLSVIVMIDASGVRYETGKQAKILNRITKELFSGKAEEINTGLKELVGHTPFQVAMGFVLGVAVAAAMFFIM